MEVNYIGNNYDINNDIDNDDIENNNNKNNINNFLCQIRFLSDLHYNLIILKLINKYI